MSVQTSKHEIDNLHLNMESAQEEKNKHQSREESEEEEDASEKKCRICLEVEGDEDAVPQGPLMQVCPCKGSVKYVHHNCMLSWFKFSGRKRCSICKTPVKYTHKLKPLRQWTWEPMKRNEKVRLLLNLCFSVTSITGIYYTAVCFYLTPASETFLMTIITLTALTHISLVILARRAWRDCMIATRKYLRRLLSRNQQIVLKPYDRKQSECKRS